MTDAEKKYSTLLQEIGELLERKNNEIAILKYQLEELRKKLRDAENHASGNKPVKIETR